jgi:hypothetical protein
MNDKKKSFENFAENQILNLGKQGDSNLQKIESFKKLNNISDYLQFVIDNLN